MFGMPFLHSTDRLCTLYVPDVWTRRSRSLLSNYQIQHSMVKGKAKTGDRDSEMDAAPWRRGYRGTRDPANMAGQKRTNTEAECPPCLPHVVSHHTVRDI